MPETFKAIVVDQQNDKFSRDIKDLNFDFIKDGDVLVKVDYSDLNYKDALILNNGAVWDLKRPSKLNSLRKPVFEYNNYSIKHTFC